jgi:hypothetical protein
MFNDDQFNQGNQFVISYELLALILWILEHEDETLAALIKKAFASGLQDTIPQNPPANDTNLLEEAQQAIIDFFSVMESHMIDSMHEKSVQKAMEKNLFPAIDQIDLAICDDETVRISVENTTNMPHNAKETPKEALCRELLRNWNPQKNQVVN